DEGRIYMWQRDGSLSCKLGISWSDDEGDTWSEMYRTDFPNTYSRAFAGRLTDGRYFIVGNNYTNFLDRNSLLVALSDDGLTFDRQYTLRTGRTTRRIEGRHKEDGYHYPNCLVDGDKLLVIHSVNKEDIEVCIADMSKVD
ncbi:MAG: exo-alpha-sialidase, partial [Candidatus Latescibacteria bacterium]|nr:exo-alpha-sialidase [Candidatus Latescibacterota bacterium]